MPSPFAEIGVVRGALTAAFRVRRQRRLVLRRRRDLENVYLEIVANLAAIRDGWDDPHLFRWNRLGQTLSTEVWRSTRYALTDPVEGAALDEHGAIVRELDALAREFEQAKQKTFVSSDWETRLLDVADQLAGVIEHASRRRPWQRALGVGAEQRSLPAPSREIRPANDPAALQRRTMEQMRDKIERQAPQD
jgi:hypothetical protein